MTESSLQSACLKLLRREMPEAIILKHNDRFTSGEPDVSVTLGVDSRYEFKYGERIKWANELQRLTCVRFERASGRCWVVMYEERRGIKRTCIVKPSKVDARGNFECELYAVGSDHQFVCDFIRSVHS